MRYTDHHVTLVESLLSAVSFDEAIAFLPAVAVELFPRPGIRYRPVADPTPCTFSVVWPEPHREHPNIPVLADICCHLRDQGGLPVGTIQWRGKHAPRTRSHCRPDDPLRMHADGSSFMSHVENWL